MKRLSSILLIGIFLAGFLYTAPVTEAQSTAQPVLLVTNDGGVGIYGKFLGEILHAEGLNYFDTSPIAAVDSALLAPYQVVVLGKTALTSGQATDFTDYVNAGGRLIAMQPDAQIKGLFGLNTLAGQQTNGYLKMLNSAAWMGSTPAAGLTSETLQIHGSADQYSLLGGAVMLAELYSDASTSTGYPAVVGKGSGTGWAVAYSYDLPANIIFTRQGNPANADQDIDGDTIFRTTDLFQGTPTWVDLDKVPVPQADEQMRFFGRLVKSAANMPLPQLWYFPGTTRTMLVLTGDAHGNPTSYFQDEINSLNALGAKLTFYLSIAGEPTDASVQSWRASGHEFGIHPYHYNLDVEYPPYNVTNLTEGYAVMESWFATTFSSPKSRTVRNHQVAWLGYTDAVDLQVAHGIAMDTDYYAWGPWLQKGDGTWAHGYVTGSGLPMKFVKIDGTILPVYQQDTQLVDEQMILGAGAHFENLTGTEGVPVSTALIDASQAGYYSALMTQFHVDYWVNGDPKDWAVGTMAYAQSLGIPMWNADQWLVFTEGRDATVYRNLSWSPVTGILSFVMDAPVVPGGDFTTLIPAIYQGNALVGVQVDGVGVTPEMMDVNSVSMATVTLPGGVHNITVSYYSDADLSITMTANPEPVLAGNDLTYAMTVHNNGPDVAKDVVVSDTLPAGVSFSSAIATQGTCSGTSQVNCALGAIPSEGSAGVTLVVTVDPAQRSTIDNIATVSAQTIDSNMTNNTATTHTTVNTATDVRVTLAGTPNPVTAGTTLTYTLTASNAGPSTANGVSAVLTLGSGLTYQSASGTNWTCAEGPAGTVTCGLSGTLAAGGNVAVQVTARVSASQSASVSSTASVTASEPDGTLSNNTASAVTTVTRSADMGITLTDLPDPVTAGTNLTYTLAVINAGPSTANGVTAVLTLGSGLTYQGYNGAGWSCTQAPVGTLTCTRGSVLDVNSSDSIQVTAIVAASQSGSVSSTASVTANETDGNSGNNSTPATTTVTRSADVAIALSTSPDPVTAGTDLTYTLSVSNVGPSTANGVSVVLTLGSGLTYQSHSGTNWTCAESSVGTLTCTRTSALEVTSDSIQVTARVAASQSGSVSSTASVTASEPDGNSGNDSASATSTVTRSADVGVTLSASPDPVTAGTNLTYTLDVSNVGPSTANNLSAVLTLGAGLTYQGKIGANWTCADSPTGTVTCTRTSALGVGSDSVQVVARVAASQSASMSSTASVTANEADANSTNNSASATTTVTRSADVGITLNDSPDPVIAGTNLTYTLAVSNTGPSTANGVSAVLTLGAGLAYQGNSGTNWTCTEGPVGTVTCSRGSPLSVNGSDSVQVTVLVDPAQKDAVSSSVIVNADEADPAGGNNQTSAGTTVDREADISIGLSDAPDPIAASQDLTYTLTVQNAGPSTAEAVAVTDTLPVGVTFKSYTSSDWTCQHNAGVVTCDPRLLQPGTSGTIQIVVTAPSEQGVIENQASVSSSTPDSQTGNNSSSAFTSVTPETDLSIQIGVDQDPAQAGIPLEYTLAVANLGVSSTNGVGVTFALPVGAEFVSASGIGWTCYFAGDVVTCTMAQLPVGQAAPVTVRLLAPTIGSDMIAHASVSSANADPVMENNTTQLTTALMHVQYLPVVTIQP